MIKTLIYVTDAGEPVAALVRGDHEINEKKLARVAGAKSVELAGESVIEKVTGAPVGFAGPQGLVVKIVADHAILTVRNGVTGGNKKDVHAVNVNPGRDFQPQLLGDIRTAADGDTCARCGGDLVISHGIEVGHVFKLGTKYADSMGALFLDPDGKSQPYIMGCYGIGVNRILAASVEQSADENGIIWPPNIAPYEVAVLPLNVKDGATMEAAEQVYETLKEAGFDVILDDRDQRPGFKFKDADLIGFPLRVVIGKKFTESGELELQWRKDGRRESVAADRVAQAAADGMVALQKSPA
jgi:prolyl-tRNA synthetase